MCISTDETVRCNRRPLMTNNEHDYSTWNINDYSDMDLSEYLTIDPKDSVSPEPLPIEPETSHAPAVLHTEEIETQVYSTNRRYLCPQCPKLWETPSKLRRHLKAHKNEKDVKYVRKVEIRRIYLPKLPPPEESLEKDFQSSNDMSSIEPEVQCPICFVIIDSQSKLSEHMNAVHTKVPIIEKPEAPSVAVKHDKRHYVCSLCNAESSSPGNLQIHMKSHQTKVFKPPTSKPKKLFTCNFCQKTFTKMTFLTKHVCVNPFEKKSKRRPTPRRHHCQNCEKKFETPSKLIRHQSVHREAFKVQKLEVSETPILEISAVTNILGDWCFISPQIA